MIFKHMDRIVFAGDSVTDMESAQPVGEGLFENVGKSYVRIVENMLSAFYPEVYIRVTNSGISGNTSRDLLQRFDRDVVSLNPDWVSICIGINDVWRQFDSPAMPDVQVSPEEYRSNVEQMILSVKDNVKGVFLMTPYYMEPNAEESGTDTQTAAAPTSKKAPDSAALPETSTKSWISADLKSSPRNPM